VLGVIWTLISQATAGTGPQLVIGGVGWFWGSGWRGLGVR
jgi:hypothetical protein